MKVSELVAEYSAARAVGLMLTDPELTDCAVRAVRFYAAYGNVSSLSKTDLQPAAGQPMPDPVPMVSEAYPVKDITQIDEEVDLTVGEWAIIAPLFYLYVERITALRLEASRSSGIDVFGRTTSEVQQDIDTMENETLPAKCFSSVLVTIC